MSPTNNMSLRMPLSYLLTILLSLLLFPRIEAIAMDPEVESFRDFDCYARLSANSLPDQVADSGEWTTAEMLEYLENNPGGDLEDEMKRLLVHRGHDSVQEILAEFRNAPAETSYYHTLAEILSQISNSERNAAFARELGEYLGQSSRSYPESAILRNMMQQLSADMYPDAAKVLKRYPDNLTVDVELRIEARVALNRLGEMNLKKDGAERIVLTPKLAESTASSQEATAQEIFAALLNHEMISEAGSVEVSARDKKGRRVFLEGSLPGDAGHWALEVGEETDRGTPVVYTISCGTACGGSWAVLMQKKDDNWMAVYWRQVAP